MKKAIPFLILLVGILVVGGVYMFVSRKNAPVVIQEEEEIVADVPLDKRPFTSLTPTDDGHWLTLKIENIVVDAASLDYELLYTVGDGRTQGVPGNIKLANQDMIERKLLLGSESSGKFRYDDGVETGTVTLKFRNDKGKLVGKLTTQFHLQSATSSLSSQDGGFTFDLASKPKKGYFVTMETFGLPSSISSKLTSTPYGIFTSSTSIPSGTPSAGWTQLDYENTSIVGLFVKTAE